MENIGARRAWRTMGCRVADVYRYGTLADLSRRTLSEYRIDRDSRGVGANRLAAMRSKSKYTYIQP